MFDIDMIVVFIILSLLFLRQFAIYKQPSKINYAPLLIIIGILGTLLHLMLHSQDNPLLLLRESVIPIFVSLLMYLILNILNQAQHSSDVLKQEELRRELEKDVKGVKDDVVELSEIVHTLNSGEVESFDNARTVLEEDIAALHVIQENQKLFIQKFEEMMHHQHDSMKNFEEFANIKMPELDNIIHRHIEVLRIAEQDHFNKIMNVLEVYKKHKDDVNAKLKDINQSITTLKDSDEAIASSIIKQTTSGLNRVFSEYESHINHLRSQSETLGTTMSENESLLQNLKEQSQTVVGQIVLVAKKMDDISKQAKQISDLHISAEHVGQERKQLEKEFLSIKNEIIAFKKQLIDSKKEAAQSRDEEIQKLSEALNEKIDMAINELYAQYQKVQNDISSTAHEFASRSKIQKTYLFDSQEL